MTRIISAICVAMFSVVTFWGCMSDNSGPTSRPTTGSGGGGCDPGAHGLDWPVGDPGQPNCGYSIIQDPPDPPRNACLEGVKIFEKVHQVTKPPQTFNDSFSVPAGGGLICIDVTNGDANREYRVVGQVAVDGKTVINSTEFKKDIYRIQKEQSANAGNHSLSTVISAGPGYFYLQVKFVKDEVHEPVKSHCNTFINSGLDADPNPFSNTKTDLAVNSYINNLPNFPKETYTYRIEYSFQVADGEETCNLVKTLSGVWGSETVSAWPYIFNKLSKAWDGTDEYGVKAPAGTYFYRFVGKLIERDVSHGTDTILDYLITQIQPVVRQDLEAPQWPSDSNLTASNILEESLTLNWTAALDDFSVKQYRLFKNGEPFVTLGGAPLTYDVTGLETNTQYIFKVEAGDAVENWSTDGPSRAVKTTAPLPPDPKEIALPLDTTVASTMFDSTSFLYTGEDCVQQGVEQDTIDPLRVGVLRGRVMDVDNNPMAGVKVTILGHGEFGYTLTRADDGMFDLVVNGGGLMTVSYERYGYPTAQRQIDVPWQDFVHVPDVVMVAYDQNATEIILAEPDIQVARGSIIEDADGIRQATMFFRPGTTATMILPDEPPQSLSTLHVRATEYTVGPRGQAAMPAILPANVAYTYCAELSADEAAGAVSLQFNQPIILYVDNFILDEFGHGFPVGSVVPVGYYDRQSGEWIASKDGLVINIVAISGGLAQIDADGDNDAEDEEDLNILNALDVHDEERAKLAELYEDEVVEDGGKSLWRAPVTHFSPYDANWPYCFPVDAVEPDVPDPTKDDDPDPDDKCESKYSSVIECQSQVLRESIGLTGTPFNLNYSSGRVSGNKSGFTLDIPITGNRVLPTSMIGAFVIIDVAGQHIETYYERESNKNLTFTWDGTNAYGEKLQGSHPVTVEICYEYQFVYAPIDQLEAMYGGGSSFARFC